MARDDFLAADRIRTMTVAAETGKSTGRFLLSRAAFGGAAIDFIHHRFGFIICPFSSAFHCVDSRVKHTPVDSLRDRMESRVKDPPPPFTVSIASSFSLFMSVLLCVVFSDMPPGFLYVYSIPDPLSQKHHMKQNPIESHLS